MASNLDARPFVDLRKDAKEFKEKFDEDVEKIIAFLDAKITALICDPDSFESPSKRTTLKSTALVEFSRAKLEIFTNVKTVINQMEREWLKYISEMKKLFVENVEIFLAGTKLEVKLPTNEFQTSPSYKRSPRKEKTSLAESIYPIIPGMIDTFAKNMAVLGSHFNKKDGAGQKRNSREFAKDSSSFNKDSSDPESDSEDERVNQTMFDQLRQSRIMFSKESSLSQLESKHFEKELAAANQGYDYMESSASESENEKKKSKQSTTPKGRPSTRLSRSSLSDDSYQESPKMKGRPGKGTPKSSLSAQKGFKGSPKYQRQTRKETSSSAASESDETTRGKSKAKTRKSEAVKPMPSRKSNVKAATSSPINHVVKETSSLESETESETVIQSAPGRKGRSTRSVKEATETPKDTQPIKNRRGKTPVISAKTVPGNKGTQKKNSSTESEDEKADSVESSLLNTRSTRRGRTPAKASKLDYVASHDIPKQRGKLKKTSQISASASSPDISSEKDDTNSQESETEIAQMVKSTTKRKGRPAKEMLGNSIDTPSQSSRTQSTEEAPISSARSKKVSFTPMKVREDDMEVFTPGVKSKTSLRRKTLAPNLTDDFSEADLTPAVSIAKGKRKTIGGIFDIAASVPPKRLKTNEKRKSASASQAEEDTVNLLESDGNYSDWIPLKSIDAKIPGKPGVYEVKVWRAKKTAYIGHCESLRQKLTLHKLMHNSGHKHLDKFIERNKDDIQIRFGTFPNVSSAQTEAKNRVKIFVSQYNTTPAYN